MSAKRPTAIAPKSFSRPNAWAALRVAAHLTVRHYPCIGCKNPPNACLMRLFEVIALDLGDFPVFAQIIFEDTVFGAFRLSIVGVENIHREPDGLFARGGKLDAFIIDEAGMFDGINPGADGSLDA